jgi:hypothetical protein
LRDVLTAEPVRRTGLQPLSVGTVQATMALKDGSPHPPFS